MAYIDKELLLKDIYKNVRFSVKSGVISPELQGARKVIDRIENAPTADVVEVVRCCECKYQITHTCRITGVKTLFCDYGEKPVAVEPTHFCSYGGRR